MTLAFDVTVDTDHRYHAMAELMREAVRTQHANTPFADAFAVSGYLYSEFDNPRVKAYTNEAGTATEVRVTDGTVILRISYH